MTREPIQIVEIVQPWCANTFGTSPCTATGEACFNTRATCKDVDNYAALDGGKSLFFSSGHVAERGVAGLGYVRPYLRSVTTAPTVLNVAGADANSKGLGLRANCRVVLSDHPDTDKIVDPYLSQRSYDPLTRSTFWLKWQARSKWFGSMTIKIYEGYAGQALAEMQVRQYVVEDISPVDDGGSVTITGKDILARIEARKAKAPALSKGVLFKDIDATQTTFEVAGALLSEYPENGRVRINDEVIRYSARTEADGILTFTVTERGSDNTPAAAHSLDDTVQVCLYFFKARIDDTLEELLTNYGGIDAGFLDLAAWQMELDTYANSYRLTRLITEPQEVVTLVAEISEQTLANLWWDERAAKIKLKVVRGVDALPPLLSDDGHIMQGFSKTRMPKERTSQVWISYGARDWTGNLQDQKNYATTFGAVDLASEGDDTNGTPSIRRIYASWLDEASLAQTTASKIITRYVETPSKASFTLDAKDRAYGVGDIVRIQHRTEVDAFGEPIISQWLIVSYKEDVFSARVSYEAISATLYGEISFIQADGAADYPGADLAPFGAAYIGDADGLLSDGTSCARVS